MYDRVTIGKVWLAAVAFVLTSGAPALTRQPERTDVSSSLAQPGLDAAALAAGEPGLDTSVNHCGQYPHAVVCYANENFPQSHDYYMCYPTLCDAVEAGASQCKKSFKGISEPC